MDEQTEQKIQAVHQLLDAFKLRVLACPAPTIKLSTLQEVVASVRAGVDAILEMRGTELESEPIELAEDTVVDDLFKTSDEPQPKPYL